MADIQFVNGLMVKAPHEKAPDFVKASISIKVADLKSWLGTQTDEWVNVDVKEGKNGKWYAAVSTYKPKDKQDKPQSTRKPANDHTGIDDDVPF